MAYNENALRHGHRRQDIYGGKSPTYRSWQSMWTRTRIKPEYAEVPIDPRWQSFDSFLVDMGERPLGTTLNRIKNERGYNKDNCNWATYREQTRNRAIVVMVNGEHLADLAARLGLTYSAAVHRLRRGQLVVDGKLIPATPGTRRRAQTTT